MILRSRLAKVSDRRRCGRQRLGFQARVALSDQRSPFPEPASIDAIEEGRAFAPKFDADGLVVCVATDTHSGDVLMVAHMNAEALQRTIATGEAWYFSRSRGALWRTPGASGQRERASEMRTDCDKEALRMSGGNHLTPQRSTPPAIT